MKQQYKVKNSERGDRIDRFLYDKLGDWSHKKIKLAIDAKQVSVNGKPTFISGWNLKPGDIVSLTIDSRAAKEEKPSRYQFVQVIFEDSHLLAVNKPAFVDYDSFVKQVNHYLKRTHSENFYPYVGQMHRLDKETSGILVFTKKKSANKLADQFRDRGIKKIYAAVVAGKVEKEIGEVDLRLEKKKFAGGKKVEVAYGDEGKESFTEYWVQERYENATFLRIRIGTGRTHQIRVHMSAIGHPVLGDKIYGKDEAFVTTPALKKLLKRHALHAWKMEFFHPITKKKIKLEAAWPADLINLVDFLRSS